MKPQRLILCGWGPYREKQEIDFTRLEERGLFLITGATGAGKTTIFDAVTYALYGNMSGEMREKNTVRSDFAGSDTPTYVELFMEHGGKAYHIYRNPEYLRPKKRKTGTDEMTKEREKAILTLPEGNKIEGSSEVTRKIQELLRLDYKQFKQLSMIAQGEFAKLLTASPSEKSKIFREIFDTEIYDKMTGILRQQSGQLYKQVMEYRHRMEEDVAMFVPGESRREEWEELTQNGIYYEGVLAFLKNAKEEQAEEERALLQEISAADRVIEKLTAELARGERINYLNDQLLREKEQEKMLHMQASEKAKEEQKYQGAIRAGEVRIYEEKWEVADRRREDTKKRTDTARIQLEELKKEESKKHPVYEKAALLTAAYEEEQRRSEVVQRKEKANREYNEQLQVLERLQKQYLQAEEKETSAKMIYEESDRSYRHGIAGILAAELMEEAPCPVCGSLHHPQKAVLSAQMPTKEEVEKQKAHYEAKREVRIKEHGQTAAAKEREMLLLQQKEALEKEAEAYEAKAGQREDFVKEYLKNHTRKEFEVQKQAYEALLVTIKEKEVFGEELQKELEMQMREAEAEKNAFTAKLAEFFEKEADYRQAFLSKESLDALGKEIAAYQEAVRENRVKMQHLQEELKERAPVDLSGLQMQLQQKKDEKTILYRKQSELLHRKKDTERLLSALCEKQEKMQQLSARYGKVKKLDDTASGNNRLRLVFEQYVLAAYFEEILKAANLRLKIMSTGRYELKRMETVGDGRSKDNLEMEVLDYYTGKYRSVKTLSGGESFKVSLALALGMSDVVQALSGGIRVEALFIDEGFGSLDSESLEQACITLQSLVEKDRLIGIISHVSELAEKIENQIRIHKTNAGSRIEVVTS